MYKEKLAQISIVTSQLYMSFNRNKEMYFLENKVQAIKMIFDKQVKYSF